MGPVLWEVLDPPLRRPAADPAHIRTVIWAFIIHRYRSVDGLDDDLDDDLDGVYEAAYKADHQEAAHCYDILEMKMHDPILLLYVGYSLLRVGRVDAMADAFDLDGGSDDEDARKYMDLVSDGILAHSRKEYAKALGFYDKAISLKSMEYMVFVAGGRTLLHLERFEEAVGAYQKAQNLEPGSFEAWLQGSVALLNVKKYAEAGKCAAKALEIWPEEHGARAVVEVAKGPSPHVGTVNLLRDVLADDPENPFNI